MSQSIWVTEKELSRCRKASNEEIIFKLVTIKSGKAGIYQERYRTTPTWQGQVGGIYMPIERFPEYYKHLKAIAKQLVEQMAAQTPAPVPPEKPAKKRR